MQIQDTATTARIHRGIALAGNVERHGDLFTVKSSDGEHWYTVNLDHGTIGETCSCPDWKLHFERNGVGRTCKHLIAVTITNAKS